MKEKYKTNPFEHSRYTQIRQKIIDCGSNNPCKEPYYKMIARDILELEGFHPIMDGPPVERIRGVPFDFLAKREDRNALIELKGSLEGWSNPGETQWARMRELLTRLAKNALEVDLYLLQISLDKGLYRLRSKDELAQQFESLDASKGKKSPMGPIVDWVRKSLENF